MGLSATGVAWEEAGGRRAVRTSGKSLCYATAPINRIGVHRLRPVPCASNSLSVR
jgi:hypothetical protein